MSAQPDSEQPQTNDSPSATTPDTLMQDVRLFLAPTPSGPRADDIDPCAQPLPTSRMGAETAHLHAESPPADDLDAWIADFIALPDADEPPPADDAAAHPHPLPASVKEAGRLQSTVPDASGSTESESAALAPSSAPAWEPRVFAAPLSPEREEDWREVARQERWEPWLTELFDRMATTQPLSDEELRAMRLYSNLLALWAFCDTPACRREGGCRASAPHCFGAVGPLVPICALPFLAHFVAGQLDHLPFDTMLAQMPEDAVQHWADWHAAVARITGRETYRGVGMG